MTRTTNERNKEKLMQYILLVRSRSSRRSSRSLEHALVLHSIKALSDAMQTSLRLRTSSVRRSSD
jgi:hypothetical protein